jgi:uncharacterized protein (TIGR00251 family)
MGAMSKLRIAEDVEGCSFSVHVIPRSRREEVIGLYGDALKVRVMAPPVDGRANTALCLFLAEKLGVSKDAVKVLSGHSSRHKRIRVIGVTAKRVFESLVETETEAT